MVAVPFAAYKLAGDVVPVGWRTRVVVAVYAGVAAVVGVRRARLLRRITLWRTAEGPTGWGGRWEEGRLT